MSEVLPITDSEFDSEVVRNEGIVIVDFYADWCGPCKQMAPLLDELASKDLGVIIRKLDVDNNPSSAEKYGIRGIPTLLFFKEGKVITSKVGLQSLDTLIEIIKEL